MPPTISESAVTKLMSIRRELEKRAQEAILKNIVENYKKKHADLLKDPAVRKAVLSYAFYKPANAILIATTIITAACLPLWALPLASSVLSPFLVSSASLLLAAFIPILIGVVVEGFFLTLSVKDEKAHAQAVSEMLRPQVQFDPSTIKDKDLNTKVDKSLEYWALIDDAVETVPEGPLHDRLENTTEEVTHWLQAVFNLAERVDQFRLNDVIKRDLDNVPQAIKTYKQKLDHESDPDVRRQLEKTIADNERQLQTLQDLENNMEKATYQLDSTISALGTIYSQLLLVGTKDESGGKVSRLQEEISEQVHQLEDLTEAMDEVYQDSY
jgi:rubrerythrin